MSEKYLTRSEAIEAWSVFFAAASVNSLPEALAFADTGLKRLEELAATYDVGRKKSDAPTKKHTEPQLQEEEEAEQRAPSLFAGGRP